MAVQVTQDQVQMVITFNPATQQFGIQTNAQGKILCYGMLDMARKTLEDAWAKAAQGPQLVVPQIQLPPSMNGGTN